jgi:hypothetical protein
MLISAECDNEHSGFMRGGPLDVDSPVRVAPAS